MQFTVPDENGDPIEFEAADTLTSRWVNAEILRGNTYPYLDFVDDVQVVFDVGANCGATSVHFARHYPTAEIHAFEPGRDALGHLEHNAAAYANVRVHPIGLFSSDEELPLYHGDGDSILGSVFKRGVNLDEHEMVRLRAADAWAAEQGIDRIDVMKVDVEGCEADVIRSLRALLPTVKALYLEYDSRAARRELRDLLAPTHDLYMGALFLDQGEAVYVRRDLADHDGARARLRVLAAATGTDLDAPPVGAADIRSGRALPSLPFLADVHTVLDVGTAGGVAADYFAEQYPQATVRSVATINADRDALAPIDIVKIDTGTPTSESVAPLGAQLAGVQAFYVVHHDRADLTALDGRLDGTHELYLGSAFLDRGTSVYLRRDLADLEAANSRLLEIFAARFNEAKA